MALRQIAGVLSMVVGLGPGAVTYLAATNQPVPILGPLVGYMPDGVISTSDPLRDLPTSTDPSSTPDGLPEVSSDPSSSDASIPEVLDGSEGEGVLIPPAPTITPDSGYADALVDLIMQPEYADKGITATKTASSDPEQVILNLIGYTYEVLYLTDGTTVISYDFKFTNAMSTEELQSVIEAESKGFPLVYRMVKESFGEAIIDGQDDYVTLVNGSSLFPVLNPPTFDELSNQLKDFSFDTDVFTMELVGLNKSIEGQLTGQIRMTIRPSGNSSTGIAEASEGSPEGDELQEGETMGEPANPPEGDTSSTDESSSSSSESEAWGAGATQTTPSSQTDASSTSEGSSGIASTPYTGRHYVK